MIRLPPERVSFSLGHAQIVPLPSQEYQVKIVAINAADFRLIAEEAITVMEAFDQEYFPHSVMIKSVTAKQTAEREWISQNTTGPWMVAYTVDSINPYFRFQLPEEAFAFKIRWA